MDKCLEQEKILSYLAKIRLTSISSKIPGNICYATIAVSHSFGLARKNSDVDIKGVFIAPIKEIFGLDSPFIQDNSFTLSTSDFDYEFHEISKFLKLMLKCNPTALEVAFVKESLLLEQNEIGKRMRELIPVVLHSGYDPKRDRAWGIWATFYGYAKSQIRKGANKTLNDVETVDAELAKLIPKGLAPEVAIDQIYSDKHKSSLIEYIDTNYDKKFFSHTIRLLSSGAHCLQTGQFLVIPSCQNFCKSILSGQVKLGEVIEYYHKLNLLYEYLRRENVLPNDPNKKLIEEFLVDVRLLSCQN